MIKKTFLLLVIPLCLLSAQPAWALTIVIDNQGQIIIQEDQVLGDEDESETETESQESESEDESDQKMAEEQAEQAKKQAEQQYEESKAALEDQYELQKKANEDIREFNKTTIEQKHEAAKKLKTIKAKENKQLKIKTEDEQTEILIESKLHDELDQFALQEMMRTGHLDIELPANLELETEAEIETEFEDEVEDDEHIENLREVKEDRRQRQDRLKIKTKVKNNGEQEIEIESGSLAARLKSTEFVIDPETNAVTITTPSGVSHTLIHLPDVAFQRMANDGLINPNDPLAESELRVEVKSDGSVIYKTKAKEIRRVLGVVPVEFENEVELDDATSQTVTSPTSESLFKQLLRSVSF